MEGQYNFPCLISYVIEIRSFCLTDAHFTSLLWVGPALLFSTATAISVLGWDGKARIILSISLPYAGKLSCYVLGCQIILEIFSACSSTLLCHCSGDLLA